MTAVILSFARDGAPETSIARRLRLTDPLHVGCQSAQEAVLAAQLLMACALPRLDRLEVAPATREREGSPPVPTVIVDDRGLYIIASADVMRRIAVTLDDNGRKGAALDLLRACDQAEALAAHYQRSVH